ncbi:MAG: TA0938 family protein [Nitrososphaerota archaeon]|jgi:hypothetical protein|nr:TA0938 family protein [Nitrososphaerota archaeon]MDG6931136.1 TA0938 family protein [Nitrososphaerota archaeon]
MKIIVNGTEAGTKETGCALCGATWGSYYQEFQGQNLFFCCDLCAKGFGKILSRSGFDKVDSIEISGNYSSGRHCTAVSGERTHRFFVRFSYDAEVSAFKEE